jgi:hypothetical protein
MCQPVNVLFSGVRGYKKYSPGFLFIFMLLSSVSMAMPKQETALRDTIPPQLFTVANIVAAPGDKGYYEITFFQSARFYKLMRDNKNCSKALQLLKQSKKHSRLLEIFLTQKFGDIIDEVRKIKK